MSAGFAEAGELKRLEALVRQAEQIGATLEAEDVPEALGALERAKARLLLRLSVPMPSAAREDRLLTVQEAAELLATTPGSLYRQAARLPFTVRQGRSLRFSSKGLATYIRGQQGRG
jgi:hypothetical protein